MENEDNDTVDQQSIREKRLEQLKPYQWKKGQSGNSLGRYLGGKGGKSGKERVKAMISGMTDDEFEEFLEGLSKQDIWEMGEGRADSKTALTVDAKVLTKFVVELDDGNDDENNQVEANAETTTGIQVPTGQGN
jgi:hypothetical protein